MMKLFYHILFIGINFNVLQACSVCFGGDSEELAVKAVNDGMLFMIGIVFFVLSCFALFMYKLNKKSKEV